MKAKRPFWVRVQGFVGHDKRKKDRLLMDVLGRYLHTIEMFRVLHHTRCKCGNNHEWDCAVGAMWSQMPTCPECQGAATAMKGVWFCPFREDGDSVPNGKDDRT